MGRDTLTYFIHFAWLVVCCQTVWLWAEEWGIGWHIFYAVLKGNAKFDGVGNFFLRGWRIMPVEMGTRVALSENISRIIRAYMKRLTHWYQHL